MPEFSGPPYQDYLAPELRPQTAEERARLLEQGLRPKVYPPPRPGHGTVFVMPPCDDDAWVGSWQDDENRMSEFEGSYAEVRDWVEAQPAPTKLIFLDALGEHVAVDEDCWARALRYSTPDRPTGRGSGRLAP